MSTKAGGHGLVSCVRRFYLQAELETRFVAVMLDLDHSVSLPEPCLWWGPVIKTLLQAIAKLPVQMLHINPGSIRERKNQSIRQSRWKWKNPEKGFIIG